MPKNEEAKRDIAERRIELDDLYNVMISYENELNNYMGALFTSGLDKSDIKPLEDILKYLMQLEYDIKEKIKSDIQIRHRFKASYVSYPYFRIMWSNEHQELFHEWDNILRYEKKLLKSLGCIEVDFYKILTELKKQYKRTSFTDFIKGESSLLHLVSTNNHKYANIKKVSDDAFLFCCQFHNDGTPSMRVNPRTNRLICYGCGTSYNIIEYIMRVENLDYYHALALLAAIYKIDFRNNPYNDESELVKKYTNPYALSKYKKRLETGYKRARFKNKNFNNYLSLQNYEREFSLIERIKNSHQIKHDRKISNKKLVYEIPEFDIK